ncbi:MAG: protein rep, partial [Halomonas sp.]|nr:protein rep [Halomonas sp.]
GTNAKSSSASSKKAYRALRYQAMGQARHWLALTAKAEGVKHPGNRYRVCACRHVPHGDVGVMRSAELESCFYKGLVTCGSVWACPVCASLIQQRRRSEIAHAIEWAEAEGLTPVLVTFTFPHKAWNGLADLIQQQREAFTRLRKTRAYSKLKPIGLIRSLEVTHGANGWHPHTHELWFCKASEAPSQLDLTHLWQSACARAGLLDDSDPAKLTAFMAHGVDVKRDMTAGDYLAKQDDSRSWGFADEVSKATSKAGRRAGVHPHHFLVRQASGDDALFVEYVQSMKGARQLFWSSGLKKRVGLDDLDDKTLADESQQPADLLAVLSVEDWKVIRGNAAHAELLDAAESGGLPAIKYLIKALR